jgi:hypothetical protein
MPYTPEQPYSLEQAQEEAARLQEIIKSGKAKTYAEAEELVEKENQEQEKEIQIEKEKLPKFKIELPPKESPDKNCFQASLGMVLEQWEREKLPDLDTLNQITHHEKGKGTWPGWGLSWLVKKGYDVKIYSNFDIKKFAELGEKYLESEEFRKKHEDKERRLTDYLSHLGVKEGVESARAIVENEIPVQTATGTTELKEIFEKIKEGERAIFLLDGDHFVPITGFDGEYIFYNNASEKGVKIDAKKTFEEFIKKWNRFNLNFVILIGKQEKTE